MDVETRVVLTQMEYDRLKKKAKKWKNMCKNLQSIEKGFSRACDTCVFKNANPDNEPCSKCRHNYISKYIDNEDEED